MNTVNLIGRLTKDIEIRITPANKKVSQFTLAVYRSKDETDFISCEAWEKTAELLQAYTRKGSQIGVSGSIRTGSYDDNGRKVYTTKVLVNSINLLDSKKAEPAEPAPEITSDDLPF